MPVIIKQKHSRVSVIWQVIMTVMLQSCGWPTRPGHPRLRWWAECCSSNAGPGTTGATSGLYHNHCILFTWRCFIWQVLLANVYTTQEYYTLLRFAGYTLRERDLHRKSGRRLRPHQATYRATPPKRGPIFLSKGFKQEGCRKGLSGKSAWQLPRLCKSGKLWLFPRQDGWRVLTRGREGFTHAPTTPSLPQV